MDSDKLYNLKKFVQGNSENLICLFIMSISAFLFLQQSPLHPWIGSDAGTDSSVFKTVALMMEHGYMPYKDSFDHKGPLLFIINFWGDRISGYRGVWVFEFLFMVTAFFMLYKIARMSCNVLTAYITAFMAISLLFTYFEGGNLTEEYAMAFITISLYIFMDYLNNDRISRLKLMLCGLCLGGVLLLRPNMISVWVVFSIVVLIRLLKEEGAGKYKKILDFLTWFLIGMIIILLPIIIWLACNNALLSCWKAYIGFNRQYISANDGIGTFAAKWISFFTFFNTIVYTASFLIQIYLCGSKKRKFDTAYIVYMIVTLLFLCLSGMSYGHYGMILVPVVVYPLSQLFAELERLEIKQISKKLILIINIYALSSIILPNWISLVSSTASNYSNRDSYKISDIVRTISSLIKENTTEDEAISVYGNWNIIYVISQRKHATRYSYQFPIGTVKPQIMDEYFEKLQEETPKIIIIAAGEYNDRMNSFLELNQYSLLWSENEDTFDGALMYLKNRGNE